MDFIFVYDEERQQKEYHTQQSIPYFMANVMMQISGLYSIVIKRYPI